MKTIYAISGSASKVSSNKRLLYSIKDILTDFDVLIDEYMLDLPLYRPEIDKNSYPDTVKNWKENIKSADIIIISTPEYIHNIPAVLKNGLEWL